MFKYIKVATDVTEKKEKRFQHVMARDKAMFVFDVFLPPALNLNSIYQGLKKENKHAFNI